MQRIEADVLIPGRGEPVRNGAVVLDGATIAYAGPIEGAPKGSGGTVVRVPALMPGMWDVHGHFMGIRTLNVEEIARTPHLRRRRSAQPDRGPWRPPFISSRLRSRVVPSPWLFVPLRRRARMSERRADAASGGSEGDQSPRFWRRRE